MKNILNQFTKQNNRLSNQISLFLGQTTLLVCLMLVSFATAQTPEGTWKLSPVDDAFGVGPNQGEIWWFNSSLMML